MKVGILGRGRLGRSLDVLLRNAGHDVDLRGRGEGPPVGDVVLLAVPDHAIALAAIGLPEGATILHCSGATDLSPVAHQPEHGSLHPLMTFPGLELGLPDLAGVPAAVAGTPVARVQARELALSLGMLPIEVPGDRRLYHAAAVMAGNFATVLLADAAEVLTHAGVERDQAIAMLLPLALRSLVNAVPDPAAALTGPIARGDHDIIEAHRAALTEAKLEDHRALYDALRGRAKELLERTTVDAPSAAPSFAGSDPDTGKTTP
jgi:predicted short-subunit dehydrogenase-like oxidoreductase (DUF2520 family)